MRRLLIIMSRVLAILTPLLLLVACTSGGDQATPTVPAGSPTDAWKTPTSPVPTIGPGPLPPVVIFPGWGGAPWPLHTVVSCDWNDRRGGALRELDPKHVPTNDSYDGLGPAIRGLGRIGSTKSYTYTVSYGTYLSTPCFTAAADDPDNMALIDKYIKAAQRQAHDTSGTPENTPVIIIAHSTSGLAVRAYIERPQFQGNIAEVFTLGTPFNGVNPHYFWIALLTVPNNMAINDYIASQNIQTNFAYDPNRTFYKKDARNPNVIYHLISAYLRDNQRHPMAKFTDFFGNHKEDDDGLVPWASAQALLGAGDYKLFNEGHDTNYADISYFSASTAIPEHARSYMLDKLDRRARIMLGTPVIPAPSPAATVTAGASTGESSALQIPCDPTLDVQAIAAIDPGVHVGDALAELVTQCHDSLKPEQLIPVARNSKLKFQVLSFDPNSADVILSRRNTEPNEINTAGIAAFNLIDNNESARLVVESIPGSAVITYSNPISPNQIYLFGPQDAQPLIRLRRPQMELKIFDSDVDPADRGRIYTISETDGQYFDFDPSNGSTLRVRTPRATKPSLQDLALQPDLAPSTRQPPNTPSTWTFP